MPQYLTITTNIESFWFFFSMFTRVLKHKDDTHAVKNDIFKHFYVKAWQSTIFLYFLILLFPVSFLLQALFYSAFSIEHMSNNSIDRFKYCILIEPVRRAFFVYDVRWENQKSIQTNEKKTTTNKWTATLSQLLWLLFIRFITN